MPSTSLPSGAKTVELQDNLSALIGLGPKTLEKLESDYNWGNNRGNPLTVADVLRVRVDERLALETRARRRISNAYVDQFLDSCLDLLGKPEYKAGHWNPSFNYKARTYGGACGISPVRSPEYFPQPLVDALATVRDQNIITNVGQSGCLTCGHEAMNELQTDLEDDGQPVLGRVSFSAQADWKGPFIRYSSANENKMSAKGIGIIVVEALEDFGVPYAWSEDSSVTIDTYPKY